MSMNKTLLAAVAALMLTPAAAFAEDFPITVSVEAKVPNADGLQISPVNGWDSLTQRMGWDLAAQTLIPIRRQIDMKSSASIDAYLIGDAVLTSAANALPLSIELHGKPLSAGVANKVEILNQTEAAASRRVDLKIATTAPTGGYVEGDYAGQVYMMFESNP
ncbi:CS1 type fimbrial major subunit [Xanthomonas sp. 60]